MHLNMLNSADIAHVVNGRLVNARVVTISIAMYVNNCCHVNQNTTNNSTYPISTIFPTTVALFCALFRLGFMVYGVFLPMIMMFTV